MRNVLKAIQICWACISAIAMIEVFYAIFSSYANDFPALRILENIKLSPLLGFAGNTSGLCVFVILMAISIVVVVHKLEKEEL